MYKKILNNSKVLNVELFFYTLSIILFLIRPVNPFFKYPFLVIYFVFILYLFKNYSHKILYIFKDIKIFSIIIILFIYFSLSCFLSNKLYLINIKDFLNIIILLSLMLPFKLFIRNKNELNKFYFYFVHLILIAALFISFVQIHIYFYSTSFENSNMFNNIQYVIDNNFALLPVILGMIGIFFLSLNETSTFQKILYNSLLFIFSINSIISGSKRGIFVFIFLFTFILIIQLFGIINKRMRNRFIYKNTFNYFISFIFFLFFSYSITIGTSVYVKNEILRKIGVKNISFIKIQITETLYRYVHFIDKKLTNDNLYQKIWSSVFDPKDPDSNWSRGNYSIVQNLTGKNVEIVPVGSKGYLLDSTCLSEHSDYHAYYFNCIKKDSIFKKDSIVASVYCYVSENFNGDAVALRADGKIVNTLDKWYDLNNKGCWQKLILPLGGLNGDISIYLYMNKGGVKDFSSLKGYVIFAYPEFARIDKNTNVKDLSSRISSFKIEESKINKSNYFINKTFTNSNIYLQSSIFTLPFVNIIALISQNPKDSDPVRVLIAKIVSEDTTYYAYKSNFKTDINTKKFGDDRLLRWKFALEIFTKEYSWSQKLFGGGFNFLNWYGYYFEKDKTKTDYPHNPFLYILLYSGILGLLLYIYLIYKVFYYYIKYIKEYYLFFIFFLVTFFFTFFSGGNPFDPPIMGFFMMLPFFIHYVHDTDSKEEL